MKNLNLEVEEKRIEVYEFIDMYGVNDSRTLIKSQELDKLILIIQKEDSLKD